MSNSKVKKNSFLQSPNNQTQIDKNPLNSSVHIFPINTFSPSISQLKRQLYAKKINSFVYQRFNDLDTIVKKVEQSGKREICLVQLQQQEQGCDTCFPKNYIFPNGINIFIVFFSFRHVKSTKPYFSVTSELVDFCYKQLKPLKIKLKSIQNLKTDKNKNSSSHSTQRQKVSYTQHELISQAQSQEYQLLFYLINDDLKFHLNQNEFNYQYLLKSIEKIQKCQPFLTLQQLLRKQLYRQEKQYLILSNFSEKLEKILRQIKSQQLSCFHILIFGDMKPVNLYLDKCILLATSDFGLIFKFLKNNGFDSPQLRQEQRRNSQRYSISSNDFRHKMDNLMNLTSEYTANSGFYSQFGEERSTIKKKIRQWMVDKDNEQSTKFVTSEIKTQQIEASSSAFKQCRSLDKSQNERKRASKIKNCYLSPKKKDSTLQAKNSRDSWTKQLDLYSKIQNYSQIKQGNKSEIDVENKKIYRPPIGIAQQKIHVGQKLATFYFPEFAQKRVQNSVQTKQPFHIINKNIKQNNNQVVQSQNFQKKVHNGIHKNQRIIQMKQQSNIEIMIRPMAENKQMNSHSVNYQSEDYRLISEIKQDESKKKMLIRIPKQQLVNEYFPNQKTHFVNTPSRQLKQVTKSRSLVKANQLLSPRKVYKGLSKKSSQVKIHTDRKFPEQISELNSDKQSVLKATDKFSSKRSKKSLLNRYSELEQTQSLNVSQNTELSKNRVSILAKKSQLSLLICGEESLEQAKTKLAHIQPKFCRFLFIVQQELNYMLTRIAECIAYSKDKIRSYQNVQNLYQILRAQEQYDLGFIFCLKRNLNVINLKLLPRNYFIVIIEPDEQSYLEISEEAKTIKLAGMGHFRLAQQIILQSKILQYIIYRKSNKQAANLAKKFISSEFIVEKIQSPFNSRLIDDYSCDFPRLTRLYFICSLEEIAQISKSLKECAENNSDFNSQSCNILYIGEKAQWTKSESSTSNIRVAFIDKMKKFKDYHEVLSQIYQGKTAQEKPIQLELFFSHQSMNIQTQLNSQYPCRFQYIQYGSLQQVEKIARQQKQLNKERKIYLLLCENQISVLKPQLFQKNFPDFQKQNSGQDCDKSVKCS